MPRTISSRDSRSQRQAAQAHGRVLPLWSPGQGRHVGEVGHVAVGVDQLAGVE